MRAAASTTRFLLQCAAASALTLVVGSSTSLGARYTGWQPEAEISNVVVYRTSGVTSVALTNGILVHIKAMPSATPAGGTKAAAPVDAPAPVAPTSQSRRVSIQAFIPVHQGVTASGHTLGHEVGMLAAAVLSAAHQAAEPATGNPPAAAAPNASGQPPRQFSRVCWLAADGLHIRMSCESAEVPAALERLRKTLFPERVDPAHFTAAYEKELRRLREGQSAEREVLDRLLGAINPAYRRPDATVMATVTADEVEQWLRATLGTAAIPEAADAGPDTKHATPVAAPPLDIGIAGPMNAAETAALAAETFGDLPSRSSGAGAGLPAGRPNGLRPGETVIEQPSESNRGLVLLAWEAPPIHDLARFRASLAAVRVLQQRLQVHMLTRFGPPPEPADGPAADATKPFEVSCRLMPGPELLPSTATVRISINDAKATPAFVANLANLVSAELEALAGRGESARPATNAEADAVTDPLVVDAGRFLASAEYWSSMLSTHRQSGLDPDDLVNAPKAYDALTGADLTAAAADFLDRGPRLRLLEWPGLER